MSVEVTLEDVECSESHVNSLKNKVSHIESSISSLQRKARITEIERSLWEVAVESRNFFETRAEWKIIVGVTVPLAVGAISLVFGRFVVSSSSYYVATGIAGAVLGTIVIALLLFVPSFETVKKHHLSSTKKIDSFRETLSSLTDGKTTLQEDLRLAYQRFKQLDSDYKNSLREHICRKLYSRNWKAMRSVEFENYLQEVFETLGYDVETTGVTGDQGVDLIVLKNRWRIAIQVKGYLNSVSNKAVQEAFSGMVHYNCQACVVVTNSLFTKSAKELADSTGCFLIDEDLNNGQKT